MRKLMLVYFIAQMHWNWLLFKQENKFQGNILNFSQKFCLILPQNRQFDFDFSKNPNKICKCGNLWQKIICARNTGNKLVFYFGLIEILKMILLIEVKSNYYKMTYMKKLRIMLWTRTLWTRTRYSVDSDSGHWTRTRMPPDSDSDSTPCGLGLGSESRVRTRSNTAYCLCALMRFHKLLVGKYWGSKYRVVNYVISQALIVPGLIKIHDYLIFFLYFTIYIHYFLFYLSFLEYWICRRRTWHANQ